MLASSLVTVHTGIIAKKKQEKTARGSTGSPGRIANLSIQQHRLRLQDVINLAAPHTWAASVIPSLFALAYSYGKTGKIRPDMAVCLFLVAILMQSAVNTFNDYADYVKGTDTPENSPAAYDAVIVYGLRPRTARNIGLTFLAAALLAGLFAVIRCGIVPLAIGFIGAAVVVLYSFGQTPISYLPLGEFVSGFVMGGLIPLAGVYMLTDRFEPVVFLLSLPLVLGIALIMYSNNGCDIGRDLEAGRRTLPCLLGQERTDRLYRVALTVWLLLPAAVFVLCGRFPSVLTYILAVPVFIHAFVTHLRRHLGPEGRGPVMGGINSLNIMLGFAYCLATLVK